MRNKSFFLYMCKNIYRFHLQAFETEERRQGGGGGGGRHGRQLGPRSQNPSSGQSSGKSVLCMLTFQLNPIKPSFSVPYL